MMASDMPIHTSLLWAHQIRRENVHLMNRIDSLERTLSSTTEAALAAKYRAANLEDLAQSLIGDNQELRDELKSISTRLIVDNQKLHDELKSAQSDNQELRDELKSIN